VIRGTRELPEPPAMRDALSITGDGARLRPFEREITFPVDVEIDKAHAEQRNGLLWISLPVSKIMSTEKLNALQPSMDPQKPTGQGTIALARTKAAPPEFRKSCRFCQCAVLSFSGTVLH